jgi:hypothetical protein
MSPQRIILVLADRSTEAQSSLHKASVLARHLDASIDIFLCDTDHAWAVREQAHSAEARAVVAACDAENERFLQALRGSVSATDLRITLSSGCAFAVHEGLAARVEQLRPMLVIKSLANGREGRARPPQPAEMQIIRSCRVPLLLSQGHQWQPVPRFCAALDANVRDEVMTRSVLLTTAQMSRDCHGATPRIDVRIPISQTFRRGGGIWSHWRFTRCPGHRSRALPISFASSGSTYSRSVALLACRPARRSPVLPSRL